VPNRPFLLRPACASQAQLRQEDAAARAAFVADVEEWSRGEVDAVTAAAAEREEAARRAATALAARCEGLEQLLEARAAAATELGAQLADARAEGARLREATARLQGDATAAAAAADAAAAAQQQEAEDGRRRLELARQEHDAVVCGVKANFAAQLGQVRAIARPLHSRRGPSVATPQLSRPAQAEPAPLLTPP
jgi:hypothetical protein